MRLGFPYFAGSAPDRVAVIDSNGHIYTRGQLAGLANSLARALRARGLRPGDAIAVLCHNSAELLGIHLAASQSGLYVVPLNWHLSVDELAYILGNAAPQAIICDDRFSAVAQQALNVAGLEPLCLPISALEEFVRSHASSPLTDPLPGRVMYYTSATTGRPKGIWTALPVDAEPWKARAHLLIDCGVLPEHGNVHLCAAMLHHRAPLDLSLLALHMGHPIVLLSRPDPQAVLAAIERHQVTTAFMVTTTFVRLLKLPADIRERYSVESLRWVNHAGTHCPPEIKAQMMQWFGPVLWEDYGSSESGSVVLCSPEDCIRFPGTVGRAVPGVTIRILDDHGNELPSGEAGLVYITVLAENRFEYKGDPEKTRAAYRGDSFTVGDIGYLNAEGCLFLRDRRIDMIVTAGTKIYPMEIEQTLATHPKVADCAVFGAPDELLGEVVMAVVQPAEGADAGPLLTQEITRYLTGKLAPYKLPRRIHYRPELPRTPSGKLLKRQLREEYLRS